MSPIVILSFLEFLSNEYVKRDEGGVLSERRRRIARSLHFIRSIVKFSVSVQVYREGCWPTLLTPSLLSTSRAYGKILGTTHLHFGTSAA